MFRLADCTPNVVELLPTLLAHGKRLMIKLSPMLDLTQAIKNVQSDDVQGTKVNWDVHVVAIKNEVKELLLVSSGTGQITAIDLAEQEKAFVFTKEEERDCLLMNGDASLNGENDEMMNWREAHRQVYYSKLAGLITPWRLGEYPARAMLMEPTPLPVIVHLPTFLWEMTKETSSKL